MGGQSGKKLGKCRLLVVVYCVVTLAASRMRRGNVADTMWSVVIIWTVFRIFSVHNIRSRAEYIIFQFLHEPKARVLGRLTLFDEGSWPLKTVGTARLQSNGFQNSTAIIYSINEAPNFQPPLQSNGSGSLFSVMAVDYWKRGWTVEAWHGWTLTYSTANAQPLSAASTAVKTVKERRQFEVRVSATTVSRSHKLGKWTANCSDRIAHILSTLFWQL